MSETRMLMPIDGMICAHCKTTVRAALEEVGATDVRADARRSGATFALPTAIAPDALRTAVRGAGYDPGPIAGSRPVTLGSRRRSESADYDLAIVGSGAAAFAAAIAGRERDARVVMIERGTVGGTCVNIGCVPSKTMLRGAEVYHSAGYHPFRGIETRAGAVDFGQTAAQKDALVERLRHDKYANLIDAYGWEFVRGEARFLDPSTLAVGDRTIRAGSVIVATGARPALPPIPGLAEAGYLTSTEALDLTQVPRSLVVIGAGYIALELGQLFRRLGSDVTLLQRGERLLPEYEPEVAEAIGAMLDREGIRVLTGIHIQRIERADTGPRLSAVVNGEPQALEAEQILVAAGRSPNVEALDLPAAGIGTDDRGAIVVNDQLQTINPAVFAAGDVTLCPQYVYVAAYQGGLAAENALTGAAKPCDLTALPGVIFTDPQVATVGLSEAQARHDGFTVKTAVLPIDVVPRAQVNYEEIGVFKLIADAATDRILGAQIVAGNAGDVVYAATLAVKHHLTVADLAASFAPYLTMAEGLKVGALAFTRDVGKLSCCAA